MASQPLRHYTFEEYLDLNGQRSEFRNGEIIPLASTTKAHARLIANLATILKAKLTCAVYGPGVSVYVEFEKRAFEPDVVVVCGADNGKRYIDNPSLIFEITSPSTQDYDSGTKFNLLKTLPSLEYYVLVSQSEVKVTVFRRIGQKNWELAEYERGENFIILNNIEVETRHIYEELFENPVAI